MIAKTFKGGRTSNGARATIAYLLNERVDKGTSKVIRGDSELTQSIINETAKKQKWCWSSGVLSFEELIKDDAKLQEIIDDFERTFFAGLKKDQYDILWVLHKDKGRTELHYIAPRCELSTGLSYNPYFVKRDFSKKDLFQEYINLKHGLSSYKDNRDVSPRSPKWRDNAKKKDIRKAFDDALIPLIKEEMISSREELIYQLSEWGYEINREGKEYISVIDAEGNSHRLKGVIYEQNFTSWEAVERKQEADRGTVANGIQRELRAIRAELDRIIEQQAHTNRERYNKKLQRVDREVSESESQELQREDERRRGELDRRTDSMEKNDINFSPHLHYLWLDIGDIRHPVPLTPSGIKSQSERHRQSRGRNTVPTNEQNTESSDRQIGEQINDSVRAKTIGRIRHVRASTRIRAEAYVELIEGIREQHKRLIENFDCQISSEFNRANTKQEQGARELNSLLAHAHSAKQEDYRAVTKATREWAGERGNNEYFIISISIIRGSIGQLFERVKQEFDKRTQNLFVGVINVLKKRKFLEVEKKKIMSQMRSDKINLTRRR